MLSQECKVDFEWWIDNVEATSNPISHGAPDLCITTDASTSGWGGVFGEQATGGKWAPEEAALHINCLELLAVNMTLATFCKDHQNVHIRVETDNIKCSCELHMPSNYFPVALYFIHGPR